MIHDARGITVGSPPVRGRGSKRSPQRHHGAVVESPPVRGRGSKLLGQRRLGGLDIVAPRAGAWIETPEFRGLIGNTKSPPVRGRGSTPAKKEKCYDPLCRPPCGGVDRNVNMSVTYDAAAE